MDLGKFSSGQLRPATLGELFDGVLALLYERGDDLERFTLVERVTAFDLPIHQRGLEHAQRAQTHGIVFLHRICDARADLIDEGQPAIDLLVPDRPDAGSVHRGPAGLALVAAAPPFQAPTRRRTARPAWATPRAWANSASPAAARQAAAATPGGS